VGLGALDELPAEEEDEEDGDTNVRGKEVSGVEVAMGEDNKVAEDQDESEVAQGEPGEVRLEGGLEHERVAVNPLGFEGLLELDVGDRNAAPGEKVGSGDEGREPQEDLVAAIIDGQVRQERDGGVMATQ